MKKVLLLLVLFPALLCCQISQTIFTKIGFYDYYTLFKDNGKSIQHIIDSNYYFNRMSELGLTHLVTYGDSGSNQGKPEPLNNTYGLKILDDNMRWHGNHDPNSDFYPFQYAYAVGNGIDNTNFPYQLGGSTAADNLESDKWGYGTNYPNIPSNNKSCMWLTTWPTPRDNVDDSYPDPDNGWLVFRHARNTSLDANTSGNFLTAELRASQQPYTYVAGTNNFVNYYISINAKIETLSGGNGNDIVAEVIINEIR